MRDCEAFVAGEGRLGALLRELPRFEPPPHMEARFLASLPAPARPDADGLFEAPASLASAVFAEAALLDAAQQPRREATLEEIRRHGVLQALGAQLGRSSEDWLAAQSAPRPARRQPFARRTWLAPLGGALAATLALGVALQLMWDAPTAPARDAAPVRAEERAPLAGARVEADVDTASAARLSRQEVASAKPAPPLELAQRPAIASPAPPAAKALAAQQGRLGASAAASTPTPYVAAPAAGDLPAHPAPRPASPPPSAPSPILAEPSAATPAPMRRQAARESAMDGLSRRQPEARAESMPPTEAPAPAPAGALSPRLEDASAIAPAGAPAPPLPQPAARERSAPTGDTSPVPQSFPLEGQDDIVAALAAAPSGVKRWIFSVAASDRAVAARLAEAVRARLARQGRDVSIDVVTGELRAGWVEVAAAGQ